MPARTPTRSSSISETLVLKGPNFWSYRPCIWMRIDLGPFRDRPTDAIAGFHDRLLALLPSLQEHHCSEGAAGGFLGGAEGPLLAEPLQAVEALLEVHRLAVDPRAVLDHVQRSRMPSATGYLRRASCRGV